MKVHIHIHPKSSVYISEGDHREGEREYDRERLRDRPPEGGDLELERDLDLRVFFLGLTGEGIEG